LDVIVVEVVEDSAAAPATDHEPHDAGGLEQSVRGVALMLVPTARSASSSRVGR
jgi:hypothetical protein